MPPESEESPGEFRVSPALEFRASFADEPRPVRPQFLVEQRDDTGWREVSRHGDAASARCEADRLARVRAAILSADAANDPN